MSMTVTESRQDESSGKGYLRISYSSPQENLQKGMTRILETLRTLE